MEDMPAFLIYRYTGRHGKVAKLRSQIEMDFS